MHSCEISLQLSGVIPGQAPFWVVRELDPIHTVLRIFWWIIYRVVEVLRKMRQWSKERQGAPYWSHQWPRPADNRDKMCNEWESPNTTVLGIPEGCMRNQASSMMNFTLEKSNLAGKQNELERTDKRKKNNQVAFVKVNLKRRWEENPAVIGTF